MRATRARLGWRSRCCTDADIEAAFAATMERRTETLDATRDIASMNDPNGGQRHHEHRTRYDDPTSRNGDCGRNPESESTSLHETPLQSY